MRYKVNYVNRYNENWEHTVYKVSGSYYSATLLSRCQLYSDPKAGSNWVREGAKNMLIPSMNPRIVGIGCENIMTKTNITSTSYYTRVKPGITVTVDGKGRYFYGGDTADYVQLSKTADYVPVTVSYDFPASEAKIINESYACYPQCEISFLLGSVYTTRDGSKLSYMSSPETPATFSLIYEIDGMDRFPLVYNKEWSVAFPYIYDSVEGWQAVNVEVMENGVWRPLGQ